VQSGAVLYGRKRSVCQPLMFKYCVPHCESSNSAVWEIDAFRQSRETRNGLILCQSTFYLGSSDMTLKCASIWKRAVCVLLFLCVLWETKERIRWRRAANAVGKQYTQVSSCVLLFARQIGLWSGKLVQVLLGATPIEHINERQLLSFLVELFSLL